MRSLSMVRCLVLFVLLGGLAGPVSGQMPPTPTTAPPRLAVVGNVDLANGTLVLMETRSIVVQAGGEPRVIVDVSMVEWSLRNARVYTAGGKELSAAELGKRLKPGVTVLISAHGQRPDPAFTRVLKEETLILVEGLRKEGKQP